MFPRFLVLGRREKIMYPLLMIIVEQQPSFSPGQKNKFFIFLIILFAIFRFISLFHSNIQTWIWLSKDNPPGTLWEKILNFSLRRGCISNIFVMSAQMKSQLKLRNIISSRKEFIRQRIQKSNVDMYLFAADITFESWKIIQFQ